MELRAWGGGGSGEERDSGRQLCRELRLGGVSLGS